MVIHLGWLPFINRRKGYKNKMKVYFLRTGSIEGKAVSYRGYLGEIENTLEAKQKYVGGLIQCVSLSPEIDLILNDEGKLMGLPLNRFWVMDGEVVDIIVGNVLCCRHDDKGNFEDIMEEDIPLILDRLKVLIKYGGRTISVPEELLMTYEEREEK